jgi:hypothetical protein
MAQEEWTCSGRKELVGNSFSTLGEAEALEVKNKRRRRRRRQQRSKPHANNSSICDSIYFFARVLQGSLAWRAEVNVHIAAFNFKGYITGCNEYA